MPATQKNAARLIATSVVASMCLLLAPIPWSGLLVSTLQNTGHLFLFFSLAYGGTKLARHCNWNIYRSASYTFLFLCALGMLAEAFQMMIAGRTAGLMDLGMNTAGTMLGITTYLLVNYQVLIPTWQTAFLAVIVAGALALLLKPAITLLVAFSLRSGLPGILNIDDPLSTLFITPIGGASLEKTSPHNRFHNLVDSSLKVSFATASFSGIAFEEPVSDWSGFESFNVAIVNREQNNVSLNLRINDSEHNHEYADRYNSRHTIVPGVNFLRISLSDVQNPGNYRSNSEGSRTMNMASIARIEFFTRSLQHPRSLEFVYIRLEK